MKLLLRILGIFTLLNFTCGTARYPKLTADTELNPGEGAKSGAIDLLKEVDADKALHEKDTYEAELSSDPISYDSNRNEPRFNELDAEVKELDDVMKLTEQDEVKEEVKKNSQIDSNLHLASQMTTDTISKSTSTSEFEIPVSLSETLVENSGNTQIDDQTPMSTKNTPASAISFKSQLTTMPKKETPSTHLNFDTVESENDAGERWKRTDEVLPAGEADDPNARAAALPPGVPPPFASTGANTPNVPVPVPRPVPVPPVPVPPPVPATPSIAVPVASPSVVANPTQPAVPVPSPQVVAIPPSPPPPTPPVVGPFHFCNPPLVFALKSCTDPFPAKYGGNFLDISAIPPPSTDTTGQGLHLKFRLKPGIFGGKGLQKIAIQMVGKTSDASKTAILGTFIPYDTDFNGGRCPSTSSFVKDSATVSKKLHHCPSDRATTGPFTPRATELDFGTHNVQEYHIRWRYSLDSTGGAWATGQVQIFVVSPIDNCILHATATVSLTNILPAAPPASGVTPPSFDCNGPPLSISQATPAENIDDSSEDHLKEFRKSLCLMKMNVEECRSTTTPAVDIEPYHPGPDLNGWIFFELKNMLTTAVPGPWFLQVVGKEGHVLGSWMTTEDMECRDLAGALDVHLPSKSFIKYLQTPPGSSPGSTAHVLEVNLDPAARPRTLARTVVLFQYHKPEANEIAAGFQLQLFTVFKISGVHCLHRVFSNVYQSKSDGEYWGQVASFPYPDKCLKTGVTLASAQLPLLLNPEVERACKVMPMTEETDKTKIPVVPELAPAPIAKPRPEEEAEFAEHIKELSPYEKETLRETQRHNQAKAVKDFDKAEFYVKCEELDKGCVGDITDCLKSRSCTTVVTYQRKEDRSEIEVLGQTQKYVAFGISRDRRMGNDSVVECVREDDGIRIYRSFNKGRTNKRLRNHSTITYLQGVYSDGWLYCNFQVFRVTKISGVTFDLAAESFYILMARGDEAIDTIVGNIRDHGAGRRLATRSKHNLMQSFGETSLYKWNRYFHAISMIVTWILLIPIATFSVRYFKETYDGVFICGNRVWFGLHVIFIGISVSLTVLAFVSAGIMTGGFGKGLRGWYFHNIGGFCLLGLMTIQMLLGIGIYKNHKAKFVFINKIHGIVGHTQFFLSSALIYRSKNIRGGIDCSDPAVLITWLVVYFIIHLLLSYQVCYVDYVQGVDVSRIYDLPALAPARITTQEPNAPGGGVRKVFFGILIFCALVTTVWILKNYIGDGRDCVEMALRNTEKKTKKQEEDSEE